MNKLLLFLLVAANLVIAQVPTNGLFAYYPFCGNSIDASGNANHLSAYNGPTLTTDRFGNANNAYLFDGINDYFQASTYGPMGTKSRSLTFWAKTTANYDYSGYTVLFYGGPNGFGTRFEVGLNGQCNSLYSDVGFGQRAVPYNTANNAWHFYAAVYDSTIANDLTAFKFYIDGNIQNSGFCYDYGATTSLSTITGSPITVGHLYPSYPRFFNGSLDEIRLYSRTLSSTEVMAIYTATSCPCPSAVSSSITGNIEVCPLSSNVYSRAPVVGATAYVWTLPSGWTGSSVTNTILVTAGNNSGIIQVAVSGLCGVGAPTTLSIVVPVSPTLGSLTGSNQICSFSTAIYSVAPMSGAISYFWTLPSGWTGSSNTNTILVTSGSNSGNILVSANYTCGTSLTSSLAVNIVAVTQPGPINGSVLVCKLSSNVYSVVPVTGATGYIWTLPSGWTGSSTSNTIFATAGSTSGIIQVAAISPCGTSAITSLSVTIRGFPTSIIGSSQICNLSTHLYSTLPVLGATSYSWSLPSGWTGTSTTSSIVVYAGSGTGTIQVWAISPCGISAPVQFLVIAKNCEDGIMEFAGEFHYNLYPNPTSGKFTIDVSEESSLIIVNALGELISDQSLNKGKNQVSIEGQSSGLYLLLLKQGERSRSIKVIKE